LSERGRIIAFGPHRRGDRQPAGEIDLGPVAMLPGLVNAHTHLELSWMRGRISQATDFPGWIRDLLALQRNGTGTGEKGGEESTGDAIAEAIAEARRSGTVLFGDISNTLASVGKLIDTDSAAVVFHELIGFKADRAERIVAEAMTRMAALPAAAGRVRVSLAAHAPYSVSPAMFQAIRQAVGRDPFARCSVHLGESKAESEFLRHGTGAWRALLEDLGVWDASWQAPACAPVEYLDRMGFITDRLVIVHGVQFGGRELARIKFSGATLVTCPRGNILTGAGTPPVADFYASGARIAVGTDSLASVPDLNLFSELAELRRLAPDVAAARLLESATISGAAALGFEGDFGAIEPGKRDSLIAVEIPESLIRASASRDVEEYLLSGITPERVRRIDDKSL
jgi:cytosine/adenosine deaminase-related metal-dependent hydrolase